MTNRLKLALAGSLALNALMQPSRLSATPPIGDCELIGGPRCGNTQCGITKKAEYNTWACTDFDTPIPTETCKCVTI